MKWLFILLLTSNLVYFGYELDRQTAFDLNGQKSLPVMPLGATELKFLDELETLPPPRNIQLANPLQDLLDPETSADSTLSEIEDELGSDALLEQTVEQQDIDETRKILEFDEASSSCFSFGPVAEQQQANGLRDWFSIQGARAGVRHTDEQGRQLFWVYLSPQDSREDAMNTIRSIREKGISDFRLISKGDMQNAISMGVFSSQASVNRRLSELKQQGYKPVVVPYSDGKRVYWVDTQLPDDEILQQKVFNDYPSRFSSVPVNCQEIAIARNSS